MYENLREERKKRKITCETMADLLGFVNKSAYSRKETGIVRFTLLEAKKIADFFNMGVDELFFENEVP